MEWIVYSRPAVIMDFWRYLFCWHRSRHQHVAAFAFDPGQKVWLFYEWSLTKLDIMTISHWQAEYLISRLITGEYDYRIVEERIANKPRLLPPLIFYCVPAIKELVGLRPRFAWTPWQLFRWIDKRGIAEDYVL